MISQLFKRDQNVNLFSFGMGHILNSHGPLSVLPKFAVHVSINWKDDVMVLAKVMNLNSPHPSNQGSGILVLVSSPIASHAMRPLADGTRFSVQRVS
jgi:hypothetical protein